MCYYCDIRVHFCFSVVCRCAEFVKAMHYNYFVINSWAQCWSSSTYYESDIIKTSGKTSEPCRGPTLNDTNCADHTEFDCGADDPYSYLYEIVDPINGKYIKYKFQVWNYYR